MGQTVYQIARISCTSKYCLPRQLKRTKTENEWMGKYQQTNTEFQHQIELVKDLMEQKEVQIKYCNTDQMIGDYFSKPFT